MAGEGSLDSGFRSGLPAALCGDLMPHPGQRLLNQQRVRDEARVALLSRLEDRIRYPQPQTLTGVSCNHWDLSRPWPSIQIVSTAAQSTAVVKLLLAGLARHLPLLLAQGVEASAEAATAPAHNLRLFHRNACSGMRVYVFEEFNMLSGRLRDWQMFVPLRQLGKTLEESAPCLKTD